MVNDDSNVTDNHLVAYRLGKVEDGVSELNKKLDRHIEVESIVAKHSFEIELLKTTKNRLIAATSGIGLIVVGAIVNFIVGKV